MTSYDRTIGWSVPIISLFIWQAHTQHTSLKTQLHKIYFKTGIRTQCTIHWIIHNWHTEYIQHHLKKISYTQGQFHLFIIVFLTTQTPVFLCVHQIFTSIRIFVYLLPNAYCSLYLAFALIGNFFHSRNRKNLVVYPTCFHLNPYATLGNTEEDKWYKIFQTFKTSLGLLSLLKNINRSDFEISQQISPVTV